MFPASLKRSLLNQAKRMSPYDTGNLRFNAIRGSRWSNSTKFRITYSSQDAYYVEYLEEGQTAGGSKDKPNQNKGFIFDTVGVLERMLIAYYGTNKKYNNKFSKKESATNKRRDYVHNKSLALYKQSREENNNGK